MSIELQVANNSSMTGFGAHTSQEVAELQKALSISQNYGATAPNSLSGGSALAVESLDRTLKLVTNSVEHLRLWKDIGKEKVDQEVFEYNVQNSYGQEVNPFFAMGGNPTNTDAQYNREYGICKYLGTQAQVHHNLTLIAAAHGPVVARETKNKTIELLSRNERFMFQADSTINSLEYDGIEAQMAAKGDDAQYLATTMDGYDTVASASVFLDANGALLDDDLLEDAALRSLNGFGMADAMYLGTDTHSKFSRQFYAKQLLAPGTSINSGQMVPQHVGSLSFSFKPSLFNRPRKAPLVVAVSASAAPTVASLASPVDGASQFTVAGTYSYVISAVYADGETVASTEINGAVSIGDKVTIDITYAGAPLYFNVFRAAVGATTGHQFIGRIAPAGTGNTHDVDFNAKLPGGATAFLLQNDGETLVWKQLGSMVKYDLATVDTSYRWNQLIYGAPLITAPKRCVVIENLG